MALYAYDIGGITISNDAIARVRARDYGGLISQLGWRPVAKVELYRGCTRRMFCSFCNEPVKSRLVAFRDPADVLDEIAALYAAEVRNMRLGQQTCFFSYLNRDVAAIEHGRSRLSHADAAGLTAEVAERGGLLVHLTGQPEILASRLAARDGCAVAADRLEAITTAYREVFGWLSACAMVVTIDTTRAVP